MSSAPVSDGRLARGASTRAQLIEAASEVLRERGFGATSLRAVADRAGVRLSLVHYHFGSKSGLLIGVLDDLTTELLERQRTMFADDRPFSAQWVTACAYLRDDVGSGYVRILWELWAAGLADPDLAARWRATQRGWRELLVERITRWQEEHDLDLPWRPQALATLIANLFEGAETEILAGFTAEEAPHLEALEACGELIARAERVG